MSNKKKFLADIGMEGLPFPMRVISKTDPQGQQTIANISINARIMHEFEAGWIDRFIQILHRHRENIGTKSLSVNILDYVKELKASNVHIDFKYPFFVEKLTPVSKEKCLVRYLCVFSVKAGSINNPQARFTIQVPAITTYPIASKKQLGGLFGQLSNVFIEIESEKDIFPEDIIDIVDKHALVPVYSFLTKEDQVYVINKIHSEEKDSVIMIDEIKNELAHNHDISWYAVRVSNYGMLHSYSTVIGTEKSYWIPYSTFE
jgi:GTP cyclohydrolase I